MTTEHRTALRESPGTGHARLDAISTIESTIPVGQTIAAYRRTRPPQPRSLLRRLARA